MMNKKLALLSCTAFIFFSQFVKAQILFSGTTYSQNFQSMTGGTTTPATLPSNTMTAVSAQTGGGSTNGWYFYGIGTTTRFGTTDGASNTGSFFAMIDAGLVNRALGSQGSGSNFGYYGMVLKNTSGCVLTNFTLSYNPSINRNPASAINAFPVSYLISSNAIVASGTGAGTFNDAAGTWNSTTLGFSTPSTGTGAPGTQALINPIFSLGTAGGTVSNIVWAPNDYLYIRWKESDESGADATAGVDNILFSTSICTGFISAVLSGSNTICSGGSANLVVNITGGVGPFTVVLNDGTTNFTTTNYTSGSPIAVSPTSTKTYSIVCISGANGCIGSGLSGTATVTVSPAVVPTINMTASPSSSVCAGTNVQFTATSANGGTNPIYSFYVDGNLIQTGSSNSFSTSAINDGDNVVCELNSNVTCGNPATVYSTITMSILNPPTINASTTTTSFCIGSAVALNASGGTTYTWNPGSLGGSSVSVFPNASTTYTVTGSNASGCTATSTITINPNTPPQLSASSTPINCNGGQSSITANGSLGLQPYTYSLNGGTYLNTSLFSNLNAATYTVNVKDANGCTSSTAVLISQPNPILVSGTFTPLTCNGATTTINVSASGGAGGFSYSLNGASFQSNVQFSNLVSGFYTVAALDANSCSISTTLLISQPTPINISTISGTVLCNGSLTTVGVSATGGQPPYFGTGVFPVTAGPYSFTVSDANGCSVTTTGNVSQPTVLNASASYGTITCNGGTTSITITASGGTPPYQGTGTFTANGGAYNYTVSDANGCTKQVTGIIPQPGLLYPQVSAGTILCHGGITNVFVNGVGGTQPYSGTGNLPAYAGTYSYTISDANGCVSAPYTITINEPPALVATATVTTPITCNGGNALVTVSVTGGTPFATTPYYIGEGLNLVTAGFSYLNVVDANGCGASAFINVSQPFPIQIATSATSSSICNNSTTTLNATGNAISYVWTPGNLAGAQQTVYPTSSTNYTVVGADASGCTSSTTLLINVSPNSGSLAQTLGSNSIPGTESFSQIQPDGTALNYYNANCQLIARVADAMGGITLGSTLAQVTVDNSIQTYNGQPYVARHYQITPTNNGPATVTLYVTQNDFTTYNNSNGAFPDLPNSGNNSDPNISNIRITKVTGNLGTGTPIVITPNAYWNGSFWELTFSVSGFSQFYIHAVNPNNSALPVAITSFYGKELNDVDQLFWTSSSEINNSFYLLQHSTDKLQFKTISKIDSKALHGNSNLELVYSTINQHPTSGHNYYQLVQEDIDGKQKICSEIIDVNRSVNGIVVSVFPNPVENKMTLKLNSESKNNFIVNLRDLSGRILSITQLNASIGENSIEIDLTSFSKGIYLIEVQNKNHQVFIGRLIKK